MLAPGSTIPVTHTQSTIPADLLQNVLRLPYRQRLALIINELGAGVAGRSGDLQAALRRAVPALTETDNLLKLLANDSRTLQRLTVNADTVVTALARNKRQVARFITEANNTATATASQQRPRCRTASRGCRASSSSCGRRWQSSAKPLPRTQPVLANLDASSSQLDRLFTDLAPFSPGGAAGGQVARPAPRPPASEAVRAAAPDGDMTSAAFAKPTPGARSEPRDRPARPRRPRPRGRARSPQPGREGLHGSGGAAPVRVQPDAGDQHVRAVRARARRRRVRRPQVHAVRDAGDDRIEPARSSGRATGSATPGWDRASRASTRLDPTNPRACVPDPGGAPPGDRGPRTTACRLTASAVARGRAPRSTRTACPGRGRRPPPAAAAASAQRSAQVQSGQARRLLSYLLDP